MALEQEVRRVERARDALGGHLDEVESRFAPKYVGGIAKTFVSYSVAKHPLAWAAGATVVVAATIGLIAWAVLSDDD